MKKLRIGILTYHFSDNFGALMQAYGLKCWLGQLGHRVEFLNYHPGHVEDGGNFHQILNPLQAKANAKIAYLKISALQRRIFGDKAQAEAFEKFRREELYVSGPRLETKGQVEEFIAKTSPIYDVIIVGSDQIWAASTQKGLDPVYYADFVVPPKTRRISYAPSFGRATVDSIHCDSMRELLSGLDGISVRERSGVKIIKSLINRDVACVPDPTLLLGDFSHAIKTAEATSSGHVFCYALRSSSGIREVAQLAASTLGTEVLSPYNVHRRWPEIGNTVYPSPKGWIALVDRAAFVVTNSFHGTVFSVLQQRPFLVVGLPGSRTSLNERSLNLLEELGLSRRFVPNGDMALAKVRMLEPIDWEAVVPRLMVMQQAGRKYLSNELFQASAMCG